MDRGRKTREPGSGQSLIAREDKPVTVGFVGVDGVFVKGAGTPAVVAADSVDIKVDTDIDEIPLGKFESSERIASRLAGNYMFLKVIGDDLRCR